MLVGPFFFARSFADQVKIANHVIIGLEVKPRLNFGGLRGGNAERLIERRIDKRYRRTAISVVEMIEADRNRI